MSQNKVVNEIFLLRCAACLSIVLLHCFDRVYGDGNGTVRLFTLLLTFGTPTFVFISEFILAYSYPRGTPRRFWGNRIKFILLPYVLFGLFYAAMKAAENTLSGKSEFMDSFLNLAWRHILIGDYHGYFILIIFQFYLLHMLFQRVAARFSAAAVIGVSLAVQLLYLGFFNFVPPLSFIPHAAYIWEKLYWLPCLGWLSYFTVAYYCGRNYSRFRIAVRRYSTAVITAAILTALIPLLLYKTGFLSVHSSKRVDMVPFTASMTFLLFYSATLLRRIPGFIIWVSKYSFGIYLFHPLYLALMIPFIGKIPVAGSGIGGVALLLAASTVLSAASVHILNKFRWGAYIVGKIGVGRSPTKVAGTNKGNTEPPIPLRVS